MLRVCARACGAARVPSYDPVASEDEEVRVVKSDGEDPVTMKRRR
jgi:hypothetical protein